MIQRMIENDLLRARSWAITSEILSAGEVLESAITDTLETNYMPTR